MRLQVKGKNVEVSEAIRTYAEEKLGRLDRQLADQTRVELEIVYGLLLDRLASFEISGSVERLSSITNGSIKHLPIRYRMA